MFNHQKNELAALCEQALRLAEQGGATAAEADLSESVGQDVQVRLGEIEQIEYQQDKSPNSVAISSAAAKPAQSSAAV